MHGGLQPGEPYRHSLNDEEEKMVTTPLIGAELSVAITQIAGTINTEEKQSLKRLLFRATRGKALAYFYDIPEERKDPKNLNGLPSKQRTVYVILF